MASRGDPLRQRNAKTGPPPPLQIGKVFPDDHSILWAPVEGLARSMELSPPAIVITQGALREIIRHLSSAPDQELLGFLIGEPCEDTKTKRRFICITGSLRTGHAIAEDEPVQIPDAEWLGQQLEVRRRHATLIGWYHSSPYLSPSPPALDLETHRARFTEPWQCGLIIATEGNQPAGGFFRAHPDPDEGGAYIPFYEQVDPEGILEGGRFRTLIDWASYSTSELVERDEDARTVHTVAAASRQTDPDAPPPPLPLMIPSPSDVWEQPTPARSRWVTAGIAAAVIAATAVIGAKVWNWQQLPEPPVASLPNQRDVAQSPAATAEAAAAQARMDSIADAASSRVAQGNTAGNAAGNTAGNNAGTDPNATQSGATTQPRATAPASGSAPSAAPAAPAAAPPPPPVTAPVASNNAAAIQLRFDSLADSLDHGMHNYQDRRTDFGQKRLSCKELAYGYRAADEAMVALAQVARDARALDPERRARYAQLIAGMDTVNTDFDESNCKRL